MSVKRKMIILLVAIAVLIAGFVVKKIEQKTEVSADVDFDTLVSETISIDEIWEIKDRNQFVTSMYLYIAEKCEYGDAMQNINDTQRVFYITQNLEMEVNNGGFSQYFFNSDGFFANEIVSAFEKIGAFKTAEICKKAIGIFPDAVPTDWEERQEFLTPDNEKEEERIEEILNECDMAFYEYEEDLEELNYQFIIKNKDSFLE